MSLRNEEWDNLVTDYKEGREARGPLFARLLKLAEKNQNKLDKIHKIVNPFAQFKEFEFVQSIIKALNE